MIPNKSAGKDMDTMANSEITKLGSAWKAADAGNPISPDIFCADPTAVEFEGRLYVYGTNDHQQLEEGTNDTNTYETIKSLVVFSTDDMVNWTYHGTVNVGGIAPWVYSSWAPSICARKEADGLTHFYLYFSNSGAGVGVITATHPLGPWSDPLGKPLIHAGMEGLGDVPNPFDPGVCINEHGVGWLTFGGGVAAHGNDAHPHTARIVQLGADMLSFASGFTEIPAPYFYEASELNVIGDTYIYTYNTNWVARTDWHYDCAPPTRCSMCYMTTQTPLAPDSWAYRGHYLANPGDFTYPDSNNHTHLQQFRGKYYLFYHTLQREAGIGGKGGYRSLCAIPLEVDAQTMTYAAGQMTDAGAAQLHPLDPFAEQQGMTLSNSADIAYETAADGAVCGVRAAEAGAWIMVRGADFGGGAEECSVQVCGKGTIEIRLDAPNGKTICAAAFDCTAPQDICTPLTAAGLHDVYFVFSSAGAVLYRWRFR